MTYRCFPQLCRCIEYNITFIEVKSLPIAVAGKIGLKSKLLMDKRPYCGVSHVTHLQDLPLRDRDGGLKLAVDQDHRPGHAIRCSCPNPHVHDVLPDTGLLVRHWCQEVSISCCRIGSKDGKGSHQGSQERRPLHGGPKCSRHA